MAELERELIAISRRVDWPAEPDLAPRVRARIEARVERAVPWRRTLVIALALLAVAIAAAFAVPSARAAILRWLGLSHVRVVHVETLPPTRRLTKADLGTKTTLAAAERRLGFHMLQPRERPDAVYVIAEYGGARVTLVYGSVAKPRLFLSEFRGVGSTKYIQKLVGQGTRVERVQVRGRPGLWFSGPHAVLYELPGYLRGVLNSKPLLAGNTLVWEARHGLTLRLEGMLTKEEAERLARSLR
jgi:hypothetical protein